RRGTPTCGAANPIPGAPYMVSIMSSMSRSISGVIASTGWARSWRTVSPYLRMGRIIGHERTSHAEHAEIAETLLRKVVDDTLDTLSGEPFHVEVQEQPYFTSRQPKVRPELR